MKVPASLSRSFLTVSAATGDNSSWSYRLQDEVSLPIRLKSLSLFQGWLPDPAVLEDHQASFVTHTHTAQVDPGASNIVGLQDTNLWPV